jgi:hypothetical protein
MTGHFCCNNGPARGLVHSPTFATSQVTGSGKPLQTGVVVVAVVVVMVVAVIVVEVTVVGQVSQRIGQVADMWVPIKRSEQEAKVNVTQSSLSGLPSQRGVVVVIGAVTEVTVGTVVVVVVVVVDVVRMHALHNTGHLMLNSGPVTALLQRLTSSAAHKT